MPSTIKIKNSNTAGAVPSSLTAGELALNRADSQLYFLNGSGVISAVTDTIDGGVPSTPAALLLHFDNSTADSSIYARTITTSGTATTSATQSKFGGYSAFFDGTSSGRIVAADGSTGSLFSFAGDFTVEAWVYLTAFSTYRTIITRYNGSNNAWIMRFEGSGSAVTSLAWYAGAASGALYNFSTSINLNQWYHVAVCRSGSSVRAFLNGTQIGSTQTNSSTMTGGSAGCLIGAGDQSGFEFPFQGYIDEVRIIPQAMYTATFTPSTSAFGQFAGSSARTQTIKLKGADAATLASVNQTPAVREPVYETDTRLLKVGDGSTAYASLGYVRPYVTATDRLLGRSTAGAGVAEEVTCTAFGRSLIDDADAATARTTIGAAATSHAHGNITSAGAIGSTANLPVITTTSGVLTTGSFGTAANSFCQGNDARLAVAAWVNFDGTASSNLSGTYSQSGTTITVTCTNHGISVGQIVALDFTSGTAVDNTVTVATVANANTFTVPAGASLTTSGNVTISRATIRGSNNVSSVADLFAGTYQINFTTALTDTNYAVIATASDGVVGPTVAYEDGGSGLRTTWFIGIKVSNLSSVLVDRSRISVAVLR